MRRLFAVLLVVIALGGSACAEERGADVDVRIEDLESEVSNLRDEFESLSERVGDPDYGTGVWEQVNDLESRISDLEGY